MASDDTLTRARAVLAGLREAEGRATPGPWAQGGPTSPDWWPNGPGDKGIVRGYDADMDEEDAAAIVALRNAAPALIRLAAAAARLVEGDPAWAWSEVGMVFACQVCGSQTGTHADDCAALAIDAALAELAALDGGEVGE